MDLTRTEFDLLASLMSTGRRVRSKADLVLTMRGQQYVTSYFVNEADKRSVEVHIANLRRKLGDDAATPRYVETVRGVGYRLAEAALGCGRPAVVGEARSGRRCLPGFRRRQPPGG